MLPQTPTWIQKAALKNDKIAQRILGTLYVTGYGKSIEQNNDKAMRWFRKAAEQGDAIAQYNVGVLLFNGKGANKNVKDAKKWFQKAAKQDCPQAQFVLMNYFKKETGVSHGMAQEMERL